MFWLRDNAASILTLCAVIILLYICIRTLITDRKSGKGCGCSGNCAGCSMNCMHSLDSLRRKGLKTEGH